MIEQHTLYVACFSTGSEMHPQYVPAVSNKCVLTFEAVMPTRSERRVSKSASQALLGAELTPLRLAERVTFGVMPASLLRENSTNVPRPLRPCTEPPLPPRPSPYPSSEPPPGARNKTLPKHQTQSCTHLPLGVLDMASSRIF